LEFGVGVLKQDAIAKMLRAVNPERWNRRAVSTVGTEIKKTIEKNEKCVMNRRPKLKPEDNILLSNPSFLEKIEQIAAIAIDPGFGGVSSRDIKEIGWAIPVAFSTYMIFISILIYFTVTTTNSAVNQKFLSLQQSTDYVCSVVPLTISATFEATYSGRWSTDPMFNLNQSIFELSFSGSQVSNDQFAGVMESFKAKLADLGNKGKRRNTLWNYLVWSTFTFHHVSTSISFSSNSDAAFFLDASSYDARGLGSRDGLCQTPMTVTFDDATKRTYLSMPIVVNNMSSNSSYPVYTEPCPKQGHFISTNFIAAGAINDGTTTLDLQVDSRAFAIAVALNLGLMDTALLVRTKPNSCVDYHCYVYSDPYYKTPPMSPIICLDKTDPFWNLTKASINGPEICFLAQNGYYQNIWISYPIMVQVKDVANGIRSCICPNDEDNIQCNSEDFTFALFYDINLKFLGGIAQLGIKMQAEYLKDPADGDLRIMQALTPVIADFVGTDYAKPADHTQLIWDKLCPWKTCAVALWEGFSLENSYQDGNFTRYINSVNLPMNQNNVELSDLSNATYNASGIMHFVQSKYGNSSVFSKPGYELLDRGMCIDSFSHSDAMDALADIAPVNLIADYYECQLTTRAALFNSIGSAAGAASLYTGILVTVLGFIFVRWMRLQKVNLTSKLKLADKTELLVEEERMQLAETLTGMLEYVKSGEKTHFDKLQSDLERFKKIVLYEPGHVLGDKATFRFENTDGDGTDDKAGGDLSSILPI